MIKNEYLECIKAYSPDHAATLWNEVEKNYSQTDRHYHTLTHLESLVSELIPLKDKFENWCTIVFAIVYHDIVYKAWKKNNEEKSADVAVKRLKEISYPDGEISRCKELILATKRHEPLDGSTNLFTDADLSILGCDSATYTAYFNQIRREYSIFPDIIYNPGRKKVLHHFLEMVRIFKTDHFYDKYEDQARVNLQEELRLLND